MKVRSATTTTNMFAFTDHAQCASVSTLLRGKLCEQFKARPARRVPPGGFVYLKGAPARSVFFVRSGLIKTSAVSEAGEELILQVFKPGEVLGELCLCTGERREQAVALDASELVEIPLPDLLSRLQRDPQAMSDFVVAVCEHLADTYEKLWSARFDSTLTRLVRVLMKLAAELGEPSDKGVTIPHYIKQEELAHLVGARREVVSSLLNRLREKGLISYPRKGRMKMDPTRLATYLSSLSRTGPRRQAGRGK
jgi:CRP/FNR family cyclic AMP-dependent transcriptional regulator